MMANAGGPYRGLCSEPPVRATMWSRIGSRWRAWWRRRRRLFLLWRGGYWRSRFWRCRLCKQARKMSEASLGDCCWVCSAPEPLIPDLRCAPPAPPVDSFTALLMEYGASEEEAEQAAVDMAVRCRAEVPTQLIRLLIVVGYQGPLWDRFSVSWAKGEDTVMVTAVEWRQFNV